MSQRWEWSKADGRGLTACMICFNELNSIAGINLFQNKTDNDHLLSHVYLSDPKKITGTYIYKRPKRQEIGH